jgi:Ca2+/H+ antiporter
MKTKKQKKSKQRKPKSTSKQTKLTDKTGFMISAIIITALIICLLCFMIGNVRMQNQAHNYCVAYNAQAELSNLAMDKLSIYTNKQYPTQHAIDCPQAVQGMEWIK